MCGHIHAPDSPHTRVLPKVSDKRTTIEFSVNYLLVRTVLVLSFVKHTRIYHFVRYVIQFKFNSPQQNVINILVHVVNQYCRSCLTCSHSVLCACRKMATIHSVCIYVLIKYASLTDNLDFGRISSVMILFGT